MVASHELEAHYGYKSEDFAWKKGGIANAQMGWWDQLIYHSCNGSLGVKKCITQIGC